jgi:hypothetical protein
MRILLLVDSSSAVSSMLNDFRAGLRALASGLPEDAEVGLVSTGGQIRIRAAPSTDRERLHTAIANFAPDGGANAFLDTLLEADERLLRSAPTHRSVIVVLTTDTGEARGEPRVDDYNEFVRDFAARGGVAHAVVVGGKGRGVISDIAMNIADNTDGTHEIVVISNAVPDRMKAVAARLVDEDALRPSR